MQLNTRTWGSGDKTAVLVHGIMSDSRTWRRVGPALAERGYRVVAVDLRGHGASPRGEYSPALFARDLVDTLTERADVAIGHSLGGLALSLAVDRLRPCRAVYCDPVWATSAPDRRVNAAAFVEGKNATREHIARLNPRWDEADIDVELATLADWDPDTSHFLGDRPCSASFPPSRWSPHSSNSPTRASSSAPRTPPTYERATSRSARSPARATPSTGTTSTAS